MHQTVSLIEAIFGLTPPSGEAITDICVRTSAQSARHSNRVLARVITNTITNSISHVTAGVFLLCGSPMAPISHADRLFCKMQLQLQCLIVLFGDSVKKRQ